VRKFSLILAWLVVALIFAVLRPTAFLSIDNMASIFGSQAVLVVLSLAMVVVMRVGEFDLAVAAIMVDASCLLCVMDVEYGVPPLLAVTITLVAGAAVGLVSGTIIVRFGVDSFIATLGVQTILQGIGLWITHGGATIVGLSSVYVDVIVSGRIAGIPLEFYYAVVLMLIMTYVFRYTVLGRRLLYVGKNKEVARLSGINVGRVKVGAFVTTGALAALAGILLAGTSASANAASGLSYLLPTFAACYLGATTSTSGEFTPLGTLIAVYFLVTGTAGLAIIGVPSSVQLAFYGGALILAVAASAALSRRRIA
jgi:ribose transport system permease protein